MTENDGRTRADEPVDASSTEASGGASAYVAWNGETYQGAPPNDWHLASDGRWWSPGTDPVQSNHNPGTSIPANALPPPGTPSPPGIPAPPLPKDSPWWRKTWGAAFIVVVGLVVVGNIARAGQNLQESQQRQERTEKIATVDETAIQDFRRSLSEANPDLDLYGDDDWIRDVANSACERGESSADQSEFRTPVRQSWRSLDEATRSAFENDLEAYHEFWILLLDTFCPSTLARLQAAG